MGNLIGSKRDLHRGETEGGDMEKRETEGETWRRETEGETWRRERLKGRHGRETEGDI